MLGQKIYKMLVDFKSLNKNSRVWVFQSVTLIDDYLVTISDKGLLIIMNKETGQIIRINDLFKNIESNTETNFFNNRNRAFCVPCSYNPTVARHPNSRFAVNEQATSYYWRCCSFFNKITIKKS